MFLTVDHTPSGALGLTHTPPPAACFLVHTLLSHGPGREQVIPHPSAWLLPLLARLSKTVRLPDTKKQTCRIPGSSRITLWLSPQQELQSVKIMTITFMCFKCNICTLVTENPTHGKTKYSHVPLTLFSHLCCLFSMKLPRKRQTLPVPLNILSWAVVLGLGA